MNTNAEPDDGHLDELALDALRAGEERPEYAAHVQSCPRCRASLERLALLEAQLKAAQPANLRVPPDLEYRIFRAYRDALGKRGPVAHPSLMRRWALPAAGLAAAAAVTLTLRLAPPATLEAPQPAAAVDIVDAFRLARALRDGRKVASGWDADGNGAVDGVDVQTMARRAVAL